MKNVLVTRDNEYAPLKIETDFPNSLFILDNNPDTYVSSENISTNFLTRYVKLEFSIPYKVKQINVKFNEVMSLDRILNCTLLASNDDITYVTLANLTQYTLTDVNANDKYKYYKVIMTATSNSATLNFYLKDILFYIEIPEYKYLLQDKTNVLYTLDSSNNLIQSPSQTLDESNYLTNGFADVSKIPIDKLKALGSLSGFKLLAYTDDTTRSNIKVTGNCNPIALNQWIYDNQCKILMWTDDTSKAEAKLVYECDQFDMIQWLKDNDCKLLAWTDDTSKSEAKLVYNTTPYSLNQWLVDNECTLHTWTDDMSKTNCKLVYGINPINLPQWLIDNSCLLNLWTDDSSKSSFEMIYNLKNSFRPLDKLNDKFDILMLKQ